MQKTNACRSKMAEEILAQAADLISTYIAQSPTQCTPVQFKLSKSVQQGDLYVPRGVGSVVKEVVKESGAKLEDVLQSHLVKAPSASQGTTASATSLFQRIAFNLQGHLFLFLNRPLIFAKCIQEVCMQRQKYGSSVEGASNSVTIIADQLLDRNQKAAAKDACQETVSHSELTVSEGRLILLMGLLSNLLKAGGHPVNWFGSSQLLETPTADDPGYPTWHLCYTFIADVPTASATRLTVESFLSSVLAPVPGDGSASLSDSSTSLSDGSASLSDGSSTNPRSSSQHKTLSRGGVGAPSPSDITSTSTSSVSEAGSVTILADTVIDAKTFLQLHNLSGRGGYDKNIDKIQVTTEGDLTPVGRLGFETCKLTCEGGGSHTVLHIAQHQKSFATQQAMALSEIWNKRNSILWNQHILLTSGTECSAGGRLTNTCTLAELMRARLHQMTGAYLIKYGDKAKGAQLQEIATRMAEAVVKFEMLSTNPKSTLKIELPATLSDLGIEMESDVRFAGAFVLYNYARLATLFTHFRKACENGVYPPLPDATEVDFSLLKEEEEWELLFHYVLQYPLVVKEAGSLKKSGIGVHVEVEIKKICLFLIKLSRAFSSYYSRVKILLAAEPHLVPLIHARLHLMAAIKQTMYNALSLLAIEPLEQL